MKIIPEDFELSWRTILPHINGHGPLHVPATVVHENPEPLEMANIIAANEDTGNGPVHHVLGKFKPPRPPEPDAEKVRGAIPINVATALLFVLIGALFAVSWWAQYKFVFDVKHQGLPAKIEASTLDGGQLIFSLLALGLSRRGLPATRTRFMIMFCALASAAMNYYAGAATSVRSTLVYVLPPIFLAMVVDEVIVVIRRHYLGDEIDSSWTAAGHLTVRMLRFSGLAFLYCIRVCLDPAGTVKGVRLLVLQATPLPVSEPEVIVITTKKPRKQIGPRKPRKEIEAPKPLTRTQMFLDEVIKRHGELSQFPLDKVSPVGSSVAGEMGLHPGTGRKALMAAVKAARGVKA